MTSSVALSSAPADAELVALTLAGRHDAFASIVSRYQSLVCSVTYSAVGSLHRSEELAHETFVTAWKQMSELREPQKLRSWLCGIARNLALSARRSDRREPVAGAQAIDAEEGAALAATAAQPAEAAVSREEEAILWRALEAVPETYRETLVLYYREGHSAAAVAAALGSSEEAVRQQLSRGRKLLQQQVAAFVEGTLARTAPGHAFTTGVLSALPPLAIGARLGAISSTAKAGSALAAVGAVGAVVSGLSGVALGTAGAYLGYQASLAQALSEEERQFSRRVFRRTVVGVGLFIGAVFALSFGWRFTGLPLSDYVVGIIGLVLTYTSICVIGGMRNQRQLKALRARAAEQRGTGPRWGGARAWSYRSARTWLGLPWISVEQATGKAAKGWIAVGDEAAYGGLAALGGRAVAPLAIGAMPIGVVALGGVPIGFVATGGICLGLFAAGGIAGGGWTFGGCALGRHAMGGLAAGWRAATGGFAISHYAAIGGEAVAPHANDALARAAIAADRFFVLGEWTGRHFLLIPVVAVVPLLIWTLISRRISRAAR